MFTLLVLATLQAGVVDLNWPVPAAPSSVHAEMVELYRARDLPNASGVCALGHAENLAPYGNSFYIDSLRASTSPEECADSDAQLKGWILLVGYSPVFDKYVTPDEAWMASPWAQNCWRIITLLRSKNFIHCAYAYSITIQQGQPAVLYRGVTAVKRQREGG